MIERADIEKWVDQQSQILDSKNWNDGSSLNIAKESALSMLNLLWPILEAYQKIPSDQRMPQRGLYVDEIEVLSELKRKLGVPLMGLKY